MVSPEMSRHRPATGVSTSPTSPRKLGFCHLKERPHGLSRQYRYTREHEWFDRATGAIGITDYAQNSLGDIVYVDVPKVGDTVTANAAFGSVESVKAVSDLFSPVSGTVTAVNEELKTTPDKINEEPHNAWIIKVELIDPGEVRRFAGCGGIPGIHKRRNRK